MSRFGGIKKRKNMKKSLIKFGIVGSLVAPILAFAINPGGLNGPTTAAPKTITQLLGLFSGFINILTAILVSVAILMFIWGVIQYVSSGGDEEKQTAARSTMIYGIIGIFVIVAVWGLVNILKNTFIGDNSTNSAPCVPYVDQYGSIINC